MKAIGFYLLISLIPTLVNSCLVVKSPPCTCPIAVLDWSNIDQFAGQSWYDYVVQRALTTPTIKPFENNCGTYIHCPRPYTLYDAEFVDVNDKRRPTQAVGHCDQKTNTWNVTDGLISHETTKWSPICVDESKEEFCTPRTNTTFLFAYSNDIEATTIQEMVSFALKDDILLSPLSSHFTSFANIRLDTQQEENIEYHFDYETWRYSMFTKLPNPSLGFSSPENGSNVLKMISKFINNTQVPICGSRLFILLKRSPNEQDITELVAQMKKYRVYVHIAASPNPSGGSNPETLPSLTTQTNGWIFYYEPFHYYYFFFSPFFYKMTLIYAANVNMSSTRSIDLPKMIVPNEDDLAYTVAYTSMTDNQPSFNITLTYIDSESENNSILLTFESSLTSGNLPRNSSVYNLKLDCEPKNNLVDTIQIRFYSKGLVNYWIPYDY